MPPIFHGGDHVRFNQRAIDCNVYGPNTAAWRGTIKRYFRIDDKAPYEERDCSDDNADGMALVVLTDDTDESDLYDPNDGCFNGGASYIEHDEGPRPVVVRADHDRGDEHTPGCAKSHPGWE